ALEFLGAFVLDVNAGCFFEGRDRIIELGFVSVHKGTAHGDNGSVELTSHCSLECSTLDISSCRNIFGGSFFSRFLGSFLGSLFSWLLGCFLSGSFFGWHLGCFLGSLFSWFFFSCCLFLRSCF